MFKWLATYACSVKNQDNTLFLQDQSSKSLPVLRMTNSLTDSMMLSVILVEDCGEVQWQQEMHLP